MQNYLHLFLDPYKRSPYLQYIYESGRHNNRPVSRQRLTLTTSPSSSLISSKRPKRHLMLRTTAHTPGRGEAITFPAASIQHQMYILILVTYMLISIPVLHTPPLLWTIVRYPTTHHHTIHIILATLGSQAVPSHMVHTTSKIVTGSIHCSCHLIQRLPFIGTCASYFTTIPTPPSTQHTVANSQLLVPPLTTGSLE